MKRVIITSIEELEKQKNKSNLVFIINKPAFNITTKQEHKWLEDLMADMRADRVANAQKNHYYSPLA